MTDKELEEINNFRVKEGLSPLKRVERKCLNCDVKFITIQNRLCTRCNIVNGRSYKNTDESRFSIKYATGKRG